jgi:hypothetical protein
VDQVAASLSTENGDARFGQWRRRTVSPSPAARRAHPIGRCRLLPNEGAKRALRTRALPTSTACSLLLAADKSLTDKSLTDSDKRQRTTIASFAMRTATASSVSSTTRR